MSMANEQTFANIPTVTPSQLRYALCRWFEVRSRGRRSVQVDWFHGRGLAATSGAPPRLGRGLWGRGGSYCLVDGRRRHRDRSRCRVDGSNPNRTCFEVAPVDTRLLEPDAEDVVVVYFNIFSCSEQYPRRAMMWSSPHHCSSRML